VRFRWEGMAYGVFPKIRPAGPVRCLHLAAGRLGPETRGYVMSPFVAAPPALCQSPAGAAVQSQVGPNIAGNLKRAILWQRAFQTMPASRFLELAPALPALRSVLHAGGMTPSVQHKAFE
jgi:hypothetical protein